MFFALPLARCGIINPLNHFVKHYNQDLSFGGFALKIEFVVFVYELIIYLWHYFLLLGYVITSLRTT